MKKWKVSIKEVCYRDVVVTARSALDAEEKVYDLCNDGSILVGDCMCDFERITTCTGEANADDKALFSDEWEKYLAYLEDWASSHSDDKFYGQSPASFDEWCDMEYLEDDDDE